MRLDGKGVIVTGGGSGIGQAVAACFAAEGASVVSVGRNLDKLERAKHEAGEAGSRIFPKAADVSSRQAVAEMAGWAEQRLGAIDILVNNAGTNIARRKLSELSVEDFDRVVDVNLKGALLRPRNLAQDA